MIATSPDISTTSAPRSGGGGKKEKKGEYIHFYFTDNKNKNGFVVDISQFLTYSMFTDPGYEIIETTF